MELKAKKMLNAETELFEVGDPVRVLMSSLHSEVRKLVKANRGKYIVVKYSPEIYYISEVLKPKPRLKDFQNTRYTLKDEDGHKLRTEIKLNNPNAPRDSKIFFGSELQKVDLKKIGKPILSSGQADKLNKINTPEFKEMIKEIEEEEKKTTKPKTELRRSERINLKENKVEPELRRSERIKSKPLK